MITNCPHYPVLSRRGARFTLPLLLLILVIAGSFVAGCSPGANALEAAALKERWPDVLSAATPARGVAGPRILRALSLIALNRNDEATCLLASVSSADVRAWDG